MESSTEEYRVQVSSVYDNLNTSPAMDPGAGVGGGFLPGEEEENMMQVVMFVYVLPVLIVIGLFGNGLTCYTVRQVPLKKYSLSVYMCAYTLSNILTLSLNSGIEWFNLVLGKRHFIHYSEPVCRLWQFFIRLVTYSGIWFVVAMTIDRYIAVWHTSRASEMCSVFVSKLSVFAILTGLTVVSIHAMWTYELSAGWCYIIPDQNDPHRLIWPYVSGLLYSLLPLVLLFIIGNLVLCGVIAKPKDRNPINADLTCTTLVLACVYFVFNTPATIINIIDNVAPLYWRMDVNVRQRLETARDIAQLLAWINYAVVLFICVLCCKSFRLQLRKILHWSKLDVDCEGDTREKCTSL